MANDNKSAIDRLADILAAGSTLGGAGSGGKKENEDWLQTFDPAPVGVRNARVAPDIKDQVHPEQPISMWDRLKNLSAEQQAELPGEAHIYDNLTGGDAQRNISGIGAERTRKLSRMADALNNKYYRSPGSAGVLSATRDGTPTGQGSDFGQKYRMPIETEEMRQMRRAGEYEGVQRRSEIERQQKYKNRDLERNNAIWQEEMRRSGMYSNEELRRAGALFDSNTSRDFGIFMQYLANVTIKDEQRHMITKAFLINPTLGALVAATMGTVTPAAQQMMYDQVAAPYIQEVLQHPDRATDILNRYQREVGKATGSGGVSGAQGVWSGVKQGFGW